MITKMMFLRIQSNIYTESIQRGTPIVTIN